MNLTDLQTVAGAAVIVVILMQIIKPAIPEAWVPASALLVGIVLVVAGGLVTQPISASNLAQSALTGLLGGASAVGLYSAQRPINVRDSGPLMRPRTDTEPEGVTP